MTSRETRFWAKVDQSAGLFDCWLWTGSRTSQGYGRINVNGRAVRAHRVGYELAHGPIPLGLWVLHRCDNPPCVNPTHLFIGDRRENMEDCARKSRLRHSRLTVDDVRAIRASRLPQTALAKQYGVHRSAIGQLRQRKTWRHVA